MAADTPTQAAEYRQRAEEIRTLVRAWNDPDTRAELVWMAACYERLAHFTGEAGKRQHVGKSNKPVH